jgi:3-phosphoshikimate 1-carboxyvinyltransferase
MAFVARIPGSRSITARALVCAALSRSKVDLTGVAECDDAWAIAACLRTLGAGITGGDGDYVVHPAAGLGGGVVDCHASGSTLRFMSALTVLTGSTVTLTGTPRLMARPMGPLFDVLRQLGKTVAVTPAGVVVSGTTTIPAEVHVDASASGQFVSGLLLAFGSLNRPTVVLAENPRSIPFITMTVDVMSAFGGRIDTEKTGGALRLTVHGGGYSAREYAVEPDVMSANYLFAAALITGDPVEVRGIPRSTSQGDARMLDVLEQMGADVTWTQDGVTVGRAATGISGTTADLRDMPDMSLTLAVVAALAETPSTFTGVANLRHKESDRLDVIVTELTKIGAHVEVSDDDDTLTIDPLHGPVSDARVETYDDHRVAMAFGLLTLLNPGVEIMDPGCVDKTWPSYFDELHRYAAVSV